jgi:hypothetical protein
MDPFTMVIAIVGIVTLGKVVSSRNRARNVGPSEAEQAELLRTQGEVRELKERIAVLERVVTDNHGSLGLDREIERLRDR